MSVPLQIVAFPDNTQFEKNEIIIDSDIFDPNDKGKSYNHRGKYIVSSSSYHGNGTMPYNAFNGSKEAYWKSNSSGNDFKFSTEIKPYTQTPYYSSNKDNSLAVYQGGGNIAFNFFSTTVVNPTGSPFKVNGEWLQIQLPKAMTLLKYNILTPPAQSSLHFFPLEFSVVGSQNGKEWYFIDQQILTSPPDVSKRAPINYNLQNPVAYSYYRLIVTKLPHGCDNLRINQWNLYGVPRKEGFIGFSNEQYSYYNIANPSLNNFSTFSISKPSYYEEFRGQKYITDEYEYGNVDLIVSGILFFLLLGVTGYIFNKK